MMAKDKPRKSGHNHLKLLKPETDMLPLVENRRADIAELCRPLHVRRLELFGSAVSGHFDPSVSDLDFLVEFDELPPSVYADAWLDLQQALQEMFGRPVDLVTLASVRNPYFRAQAVANRETVYAA